MLVANPWISASLLIPFSVLLFDYINYYRLRKRLGGIAVVGDASWFWRRLRWTEIDANFHKVFQRGYDNVCTETFRRDFSFLCAPNVQ